MREVREVLAHLTGVNVLQHTHVSNHHIVHLKLMQSSMSIILSKTGGKNQKRKRKRKKKPFMVLLLEKRPSLAHRVVGGVWGGRTSCRPPGKGHTVPPHMCPSAPWPRGRAFGLCLLQDVKAPRPEWALCRRPLLLSLSMAGICRPSKVTTDPPIKPLISHVREFPLAD